MTKDQLQLKREADNTKAKVDCRRSKEKSPKTTVNVIKAAQIFQSAVEAESVSTSMTESRKNARMRQIALQVEKEVLRKMAEEK